MTAFDPSKYEFLNQKDFPEVPPPKKFKVLVVGVDGVHLAYSGVHEIRDEDTFFRVIIAGRGYVLLNKNSIHRIETYVE